MDRSTSRPQPLTTPRAAARGGALRVFVVEGDGSFGRQVARALEAHGMVARAIVGGQAALDEVAIDRPDLVVLCAELPDMSGYAVCSRLKRNKDSESIPIILTSARADTQAFRSHRRLWVRADAYLRKPFEAKALADLLRKTAALVEVRSERLASARARDEDGSRAAARRELPGEVDGGAEPDVLEDGFVYLGGGPASVPLEEGLVTIVVEPPAPAAQDDDVLEDGFVYLGGGPEVQVLDAGQVCVAGLESVVKAAARTAPGRWKLPASFGAAA